MKKIVLMLAAAFCLGMTGTYAQRPSKANPQNTEKRTVDNSARRSSGYKTNGRPSLTKQMQSEPDKTVKSKRPSNPPERQVNKQMQPRPDRFNGNTARK